MVRHFKTKHQAVYLKLLPIIRRKTNKSQPAARTNNCWVKKYTTAIGENEYRCDICHKILKMPKAHGNMKRHIRLKHPKIFELETKIFLLNSEEESITNATLPSKVEKVLLQEEKQIIEDEIEYLDESIIAENDPEPGPSTSITGVFLPEEDEDTSKQEEIAFQNVDDLETESESNDFGEINFLSEKDPDYESKIKWLAQRVIPGKRKFRPCIWNFFNIIKENHIYSCIFCQKDVAIVPFSSSNLKRHIKINHKKTFEIILKYGPEFQNKDDTSLSKLMDSVKPADDFTKSFETSYFDAIEDSKFKCKSCNGIVESSEPDSLLLFKHIYEKHSDEVISHIKDNVEDDEEFSVLFVKKKDL